MYLYLKKASLKILKMLAYFLPSAKSSAVTDFGIGMLLCHHDVPNVIYSLHSFFYQMKDSFPVYVIDDGSLTEEDMSILHKKFTITIERASSVLSRFKKKYKRWERFITYLENTDAHIIRFMLAVPYASPFERTVIIEPDVLFFNPPQEIKDFRNSKKNYFQVLSKSTYNMLVQKNLHLDFSLRRYFYSHLNIPAHFLYNSGLMCVNKRHLTLQVFKRIEAILKISVKIDYHMFRNIEETLLSIIFTKATSIPLPAQKYRTVLFSSEYMFIQNKGDYKDVISLHLTSEVRHIFIYLATRMVFQTGLFRKKIPS